MGTASPRRETVEQLAEDFVERYRRGEHPALSEYTDRYPEHAEQIRDLFPALVMMEQIAPGSESGPLPALERLPRQRPGEHPERIGDYRLIRVIGHGGMGIVYEAEQVSLGRHVALKVLPRKMLVETKHRRRFEREARLAAKLHHTNIVPVFGVGEHAGTPYYVMQFIQGLGLDEVLEELKRMRGGGDGARAAGLDGGETRAARRDVSAAEVARSLMTGRFEAGAAAGFDTGTGPGSGSAAASVGAGPSAGRPSAVRSGRAMAEASGRGGVAAPAGPPGCRRARSAITRSSPAPSMNCMA